MITLQVSDVLVDTTATQLRGLADAEFVQINGSWAIAVAAEADGAISIFNFADGTIGALQGDVGYSSVSGTQTAWDLSIFDAHGETVIAASTRYEDFSKFYTVEGSGALTRQGVAVAGDLGLTEVIQIDGITYLYAPTRGSDSLTAYRVESDFSLTTLQTLTDTASTFLGDVTAMASVTIGGVDYLFAASGFDAGLGSYTVGPNGHLTLVDTVSPLDGSGFFRIADLEVASAGGKDFLVMASAGTSSLTVFEVGAGGSLTEVSHSIDTLGQRYQGASELTTFEFGGRVYVAAAGSDDGVTILELGADGSLTFEGTVADTYATTLDNVTALDAQVVDGTAYLMVGSGSDHGVTVFELNIDPSTTVVSDPGITPGTPADPDPDPVPPSTTMSGSDSGDDVLQGTETGEVLAGLGGNDKLFGNGGDDRIIDGNGVDVLNGGDGADTFVFVTDYAIDLVQDFEAGKDRIDLSNLSGIDSMADVTLEQDCMGVTIKTNFDDIILMSSDDTALTLAEVMASDFIF